MCIRSIALSETVRVSVLARWSAHSGVFVFERTLERSSLTVVKEGVFSFVLVVMLFEGMVRRRVAASECYSPFQ